MDPRKYWSTYGMRDFPTLAKVAARIFQVQTSAASSERCWSMLSFIETKSRNRLNVDTLEKLAFCKINAMLKNSSMTEPWMDEEEYF